MKRIDEEWAKTNKDQSGNIRCALCGRYYPQKHIKGVFCKGCNNDPYLHKRRLRAILYRKQNHQCIVNDCPYDPKGIIGDGFHVHRIIPGKNKGGYNLENCVLVCKYHHRKIEGLSREEIKNIKCSKEETERMPKKYTRRSIVEVSIYELTNAIIDVFDEFYVPIDEIRIANAIWCLLDKKNFNIVEEFPYRQNRESAQELQKRINRIDLFVNRLLYQGE